MTGLDSYVPVEKVVVSFSRWAYDCLLLFMRCDCGFIFCFKLTESVGGFGGYGRPVCIKVERGNGSHG